MKGSEYCLHINSKNILVVVELFFFYFFFSPVAHGLPRLGVKSELQLLSCTTATTMPDLSCLCDLHCSLWQCQILNPLSEVRD